MSFNYKPKIVGL